MSLRLTQSRPEELSKSELEVFYANELIPAEKKPFLTDFSKAQGALLATEKGRYILDSSSQIATLGLGFNPTAFYGVTHHLESWINDNQSVDLLLLRKGYENFLQRKLGWNKLHAHFCNSGAEANEIALGWAFETRPNKQAKQVLAFEGSFHGRMLVSLSLTSNPTKREPYEWPSTKATFLPWPDSKVDHRASAPLPPNWIEVWENASHKDTETLAKEWMGRDPLLDREVQSLLATRQALITGRYFALILEPRQCEGGDRYASFRFHLGLANLVRAFSVTLIYDEVQCGYGLSGTFFWHTMFGLRNSKGESIAPDFLTVAKKAQLGLVLSPSHRIGFEESFATHSMIRGYYQALMMDQTADRVPRMESQIRDRLAALVQEYPNDLENPRAQGLSFSVDFKDKTTCDKFIAKRFEHGLLYYPAGNQTARFRFNMSFGERETEAFFAEVRRVLNDIKGLPPSNEISEFSQQSDLEWLNSVHKAQVERSLIALQNKKLSSTELKKLALQTIENSPTGKELQLKATWIDQSNFESVSQSIQNLQKLAYEPARQTPDADFRKAVQSPLGFGIAVHQNSELVGIGFLGSLSHFPLVRGTGNDPFFKLDRVLYSLDMTVAPSLQGKGLGQALKMAALIGAESVGARRVQGRNRDRLAGAMFSINLSLGAYELQHLSNDYPDNEKYRDSLYYTQRVSWQLPQLKLSSGIKAPLSVSQLDKSYVDTYFSTQLNKVSLANFASKTFLENLRLVMQHLPEPLRHAYSTSGQSECVEKIIKVLWTKRKSEKMISFEGCHFGAGSFAARVLSGHRPSLLPALQLPRPTPENWQSVLTQLEQELQKETALAVWVEPLSQRDGSRLPLPFLKALSALCKTKNTPLVSNESAASLWRYDSSHFSAAELFSPDLCFVWVGAQCGLIGCSKEYFVAKPLELISTWDGDEISLAAYSQVLRAEQKVSAAARKDRNQKFEAKLRSLLTQYPSESMELENGIGHFSAVLPPKISNWFERVSPNSNEYLVLPSPGEMNRFLETAE